VTSSPQHDVIFRNPAAREALEVSHYNAALHALAFADRNNSISLLDQQNSPLLCLPAELRNQIYGYVFRPDTWASVFRTNTWSVNRTGHAYTHDLVTVFGKPTRPQLALLLACRQIYHETHLLPFILNRFTILDNSNMFAFLAKLNSAQKAAITRLEVEERFSHNANGRLGQKLQEMHDRIAKHRLALPKLREIDFHLFVWAGTAIVILDSSRRWRRGF
jgi:hypothetical protein